MLFAILTVVASFQLDIDCFQVQLFEQSYQDPYSKKWNDPKGISSCIQNDDNHASDTISGSFKYVLKNAPRHEFRFNFDTATCYSEVRFRYPIDGKWSSDSLKAAAAIYSEFDTLQYRRVAESMAWYKISEIRQPCSLKAILVSGYNGFFEYEFNCKYPKNKKSSCFEIVNTK